MASKWGLRCDIVPLCAEMLPIRLRQLAYGEHIDRALFPRRTQNLPVPKPGFIPWLDARVAQGGVCVREDKKKRPLVNFCRTGRKLLSEVRPASLRAPVTSRGLIVWRSMA
jgi:hypothetical protein